MKAILFLSLCLSASLSWAQSGYSTKNIPDTLLKNADAVVREDLEKVDIQSEKKVVTTYKYTITILSERAKELANFKCFYDKQSRLSDFKGTIFNDKGEKVKKIKESDLTDRSISSENTLFQDDRVKYYELNYPTYPFTVEYEWTEVESRLFMLPQWTATNHFDAAVEKASIEVVYPAGIELKLKSNNLTGEIVKSEKDGKKVISYSVKNLPALKEEPLSPEMPKITQYINFTCNKINYDSFVGSQENWNEFGQSFYKLWSNRDEVSPALTAKFAGLKGKPNMEILSAVRNHLKENTRYVNVSLGVGGFQPFKASDVEKTGYGDCKALTNFAFALFKAAGVYTIPSLVNTYNREVDDNFTKSNFNHVFLCIPNGKDSLWLECTNPSYPAGYLPDDDCGRKVLTFSPDGGKLAKTPKPAVNKNLQSRVVNFTISETGAASGSIEKISYNERSELANALTETNAEDQRKYILKNLPFVSPELSKISFKNYNTPDLKFGENYEIAINSFASTVGKRMFIPVIPMGRMSIIEKCENRKFPVKIDDRSKLVDTIKYTLPHGYKVEAMPAPKKIESVFGSYSCTVAAANGIVTVTREVVLKDGMFEPKKYADLYDFYKSMSSNDYAKVVIVKDNSN